MSIKCFYKTQLLSKRSLSSVPLKDRRKIHRFRTFYQVHNMVIALPVPHYFQQSLRLTRSRSMHIKLSARHDCYLLSFFPRTIKDWNLIPSTKVIEIFVITWAIIFLVYLIFLIISVRCESVKEYVRRSRSAGSASQEPGFTRFLFLSSKLYDNNSPFVLFLFVLHQPRCYWYWLLLFVAFFGWSL